jgi:hypothetical protein
MLLLRGPGFTKRRCSTNMSPLVAGSVSKVWQIKTTLTLEYFVPHGASSGVPAKREVSQTPVLSSATVTLCYIKIVPQKSASRLLYGKSVKHSDVFVCDSGE